MNTLDSNAWSRLLPPLGTHLHDLRINDKVPIPAAELPPNLGYDDPSFSLDSAHAKFPFRKAMAANQISSNTSPGASRRGTGNFDAVSRLLLMGLGLIQKLFPQPKSFVFQNQILSNKLSKNRVFSGARRNAGCEA